MCQNGQLKVGYAPNSHNLAPLFFARLCADVKEYPEPEVGLGLGL